MRLWEAGAFERMREYIHENPVKRGLVGVGAEYPYSSANSKFELDPPPQRLKARHWTGAGGIAKAMP